MSKLSNDKAFDSGELGRLKSSSKTLLNGAKKLNKDLKKDFRKIEDLVSDLPSDVKDSGLLRSLSDTKLVNDNEIDRTLNKMQRSLTKAENDIFAYDKSAAKAIKAASNEITNISKQIAGLEGLLTSVSVMSDPSDFMKNLEAEMKKLGMDKTKDNLKNILSQLLGLAIMCNEFSKDPVNLATGNLIYDKVDLSSASLQPLILKRFYNAQAQYDGSFGAHWLHNYESRIISVSKELIEVLFDDGHVEEFNHKQSNQYLAKSGNELLIVDEEVIIKKDQQKFIYQDTKLIKIKDAIKEINLEYDENNRLIIVSSQQELISFTYNENNQISQVSNEKGFKVNYEYENNDLIYCKDNNDKQYNYYYDDNHALLKIINPYGVNVLSNEYDTKQRTTKQSFPDQSEMFYHYDDENKLIELIERNKQKIIYYRDDLYRNTKIEYSDGFEEYRYNEFNKKSIYVDKNNNLYRYKYDDKANLIAISNPLRKTRYLEYNQNNKPSKVILENEATYLMEYDDSDNLISLTNSLNQTMKMKYDEKNLLIEVINFDGSLKQLSYDNHKNLAKVVDELGHETKLEYNEYQQVIKEIKANNHYLEYEYTKTNQIAKIINEAKQTREYTYNIIDDVIKIKDFDGKETLLEYNNLNKISKIIEPSGASTNIEYDKMWNINKVIYANKACQAYHYNLLNQLASFTNELGGQLFYEYDGNGNVIKISDENDLIITKKYDALNRELASFTNDKIEVSYEYDEVGNIIKVTNALNETKTFSYDLENNLISAIDEANQTTSYTYTPLNQVASITNPYGGVINYEYYPGGLLKAELSAHDQTYYTYNELKQVSSIKQNEQLTTYEYDILGNIINETNHIGQSKQYFYNASNLVSKYIDENKQETNYEYDSSNNLIRVVDALNNEMIYEYDIMNNLKTVSQVNEDNKHCLYQYTRNELNQITQVINVAGQVEQQSYDNYGRLIKQVNSDQTFKEYEYHNGLLSSIKDSFNNITNYEYDALNQVTKIKEKLGIIEFSYDNKGNVTSVSDVDNKVTKYTYGHLNELVKHEYSDARQVNYQYDINLRLESIKTNQQEVIYSYNKSNQISSKQIDKLVTHYEYDELSRLQKLSHINNKDLISEYEYNYDNCSNIISLNKQGQTKDTGLYVYEYDVLNRLKQTNKDNQILNTYEYDNQNNRTKQNETTYLYNDYGQLVKTIDNNSIKEYEYDQRGNIRKVLEDSVLKQEYIYNIDNRLTKATTPKGLVEFEYNSLNKLIAKTSNSVKTTYEIDHLKPFNDIIATRKNNEVRTYLYDGLGVIAENEDIALLDHLGTPTTLINQNTITKQRVFDEFGVSSDVLDNELGYTGYLYDEVSQLNYAQARFYNASNARFNGLDNLVNYDETPSGFNRYNYVGNDPVNYVDMDGNVKMPSTNEKYGSSENALVNNNLKNNDDKNFKIDFGKTIDIQSTSLQVLGEKIIKNKLPVNYKPITIKNPKVGKPPISTNPFASSNKGFDNINQLTSKVGKGSTYLGKILGVLGIGTTVYDDTVVQKKTTAQTITHVVFVGAVTAIAGRYGGPLGGLAGGYLAEKLYQAGLDKFLDKIVEGILNGDAYNGMVSGGKKFFAGGYDEKYGSSHLGNCSNTK